MTSLRQRMLEDMQVRQLSPCTRSSGARNPQNPWVGERTAARYSGEEATRANPCPIGGHRACGRRLVVAVQVSVDVHRGDRRPFER